MAKTQEKLTKNQAKEVKKAVDKQLKKDEKVLEKKIEQKLHKRLLSATKNKTVFIHNKFKDHASTAIIAAFGFLIALSWRDPIKAIVDDRVRLSTFESIPYAAEFLSAIIITIIAVFGIMLVAKWANKDEKK